ncbi:MAG: rhodanese-like domain-containing protein [Mobilitalea sp.]
MKKNIILIALLCITTLALTGCASSKSSDPSNDSTNIETNDNVIESEVTKTPTSSQSTPILEIISAETAKEMMDSSSDLIILDVRTEEEYNSEHIDGAILIPDYEIEAKAEEILEDKSKTILVYCRSGRRSALAAQILNDLGYTMIYDFGGIVDWPYDTVSE